MGPYAALLPRHPPSRGTTYHPTGRGIAEQEAKVP
jgi:hypothetical protein